MMVKKYRLSAWAVCIFLCVLAGCQKPQVLYDLSDTSFSLVNQDSTAVNFPGAFKDEYVIAAFIYTHCPDVCRITTANMSNINNKLTNDTNVRFVEITFDPERDTPSVLKNYMQLYGLDEGQFTMLTGNPAEIDSLLARLDIKIEISFTDTTQSGTTNYYFNHTDRILIIDKKGRVRFEYPGSLVPPEHVVEDLNTLR